MTADHLYITVLIERGDSIAGAIAHSQTDAHAPTLDHLAQRYFDTNARLVSQPKLRARYEGHIKPTLGSRAAHTIVRSDLMRLYHDKRREVVRRGNRRIAAGATYSKAFCKSLLDIVGVIYGHELAGENPQIRRNPMAGLYKAHPEIAHLANEKDRTFTTHEAAAILQLATRSDPIAYRFILLAIATGARRGALLRLKRREIDLAAGTIRLIDEKAENGGAKEGAYTIPLCSFARDRLADFLAALEPNDPIVWGSYRSRQSGALPTAQTINHRVQPLIDAVVEGNGEAQGNARLSLHAFRSFAITTLLDSGCPEFLARRFSNHSTARRGSFDRYAKATIEQIRPHLERSMAFLHALEENPILLKEHK
ncbi:hypothetical protein AGMMS50229_09660 [Campylobacterota bacterium]|nr:hypothetical protein AGMMS50229_09660 [Campylobacterota bacterium]